MMAIQTATCTNLHIRSPHDARKIFHAVYTNTLPMVTRRLDADERQMICSGSVYVWEERGHQTDLTGVGIERWTDGIRWGPSRVRDGFLFYQEKRDRIAGHMGDPYNSENTSRHDLSVLNKQTYTVYVETPRGQRKWHLIAYFTQETLSNLRNIDSFPHLAQMHVPPGNYQSARNPKGRPEHIFNSESPTSGDYGAYSPTGGMHHSSQPSPNFIMWPNTRRGNYRPTSYGSNYGSGYGAASPSRDHSESPSSMSNGGELAPLDFLESHPRPRRHPTDQVMIQQIESRAPTPHCLCTPYQTTQGSCYICRQRRT